MRRPRCGGPGPSVSRWEWTCFTSSAPLRALGTEGAGDTALHHADFVCHVFASPETKNPEKR